MNGDADFTDTALGDLDETNTFSDANELKTRDTDSVGGADITLAQNLRGDLTTAGNNRTLVYDAFGRLRKVNRTDNGNPITEYTYNGLGFRISWHYDVNASGATDGSDPVYRFAHDERWRVVATYRGSDSSPKEQYVFHVAGDGGFGGSSYIDLVIGRWKDANSGWTSAADGALEQLYFTCQNWRADVVAITKSDGAGVVEYVKYLSYGTPVNIARCDANYDGTVNSTDSSTFSTLWAAGTGAYDVLGDMNMDGVCNSTDLTLFSSDWSTTPATGYDRLSRSDTTTNVDNRIGYAGYQWDPVVEVYHVRNRVLDPHAGRWTRRDPIGYIDGMSLYEYVRSMSLLAVDPLGLACAYECCGRCPGGERVCIYAVAPCHGTLIGTHPPSAACRTALLVYCQCKADGNWTYECWLSAFGIYESMLFGGII